VTVAVIVLVALGVVALAYAVAATVTLVRTPSLEPTQKVAQGLVAWLLPIGGPILVMHLVSDTDQEAVPWRCSSNDTVNLYVWQVMTLHGRAALRLTLEAAEHGLVEAVSDLVEGSGGDGGGGDGGGGD
jgi:hypothetical protein